MTTVKAIRNLKLLRRKVLADNVVDWDETSELLESIRPLAQSHGFLFQDYIRLLEKCREDGKISKNESEKLALQLDFLCNFFTNLRLRFWLVVTTVLLVVTAVFVVGNKLVSALATAKQPDQAAETSNNCF